jgi:hypothetical protein
MFRWRDGDRSCCDARRFLVCCSCPFPCSPPPPGDKDIGALLLERSPDGGKTWDPLPPIKRWVDRPWISVDCSATPTRGRVYVDGSIRQCALYVSQDLGKSFGLPQIWSARQPYRSFGISNPVVLSDGTLVVLYNGYLDSFEQKKGIPYLAVRRSTDGGKSLGDEIVVGSWNAINSPQLGLATLAIDPGSRQFKDRLYAVWTDITASGMRVMLAHSADHGLTWSKPALLSEQPEGKADEKIYDALIPSVAVNKAGVVAVSWYDRRELPPDGKGWNIRLRASSDGGQTWIPSIQINEVTSKQHGSEALGHTAGMAADASGTFHPTWIDQRTGTLQVWTASVTVAAE